MAERTRELQESNHLLEQRSRELERLALTDPLTGLFNRRAMEELARFELKRHARYPSPLTLGYIDVDHFKQVNTDYHLTGGDEVLRALARILVGTLREVDSVGRIGGEEFLVIARETNEEGALILAERIRSTVEQDGHRIPEPRHHHYGERRLRGGRSGRAGGLSGNGRGGRGRPANAPRIRAATAAKSAAWNPKPR